MQIRLGRPARLVLTLAMILVPLLATGAPGALAAGPTKSFRLELTNSTGQPLAPLALIAAPEGWRLFTLGEPASAELELLAETGNPQPLVDLALSQGAYSAVATDAPLAPGESTSVEFDSPVFGVEFWALMMPIYTNDGFFVFHSAAAPTKFATFMMQLRLYDAGTEVNTESAADVPGLGGTGSVDEGGVVTMHQGLRGDVDVDSGIYRLDGGVWSNFSRTSTRPNPGPSPQLQHYSLTISNLTGGQPFSPPVIAVSHKPLHPFMLGEPASDAIQAIAESGDNSLLAMQFMEQGASTVIALGDLVMPGESVTVEFDAPKLARIVWCSMLGATNDGFTCGMDRLPTKFEELSAETSGYDAGTEVNTESAGDLIALGGMTHVEEDGVVTHHPGIQGGADLDPAIFNWTDPVGQFTIERSE